MKGDSITKPSIYLKHLMIYDPHSFNFHIPAKLIISHSIMSHKISKCYCLISLQSVMHDRSRLTQHKVAEEC